MRSILTYILIGGGFLNLLTWLIAATLHASQSWRTRGQHYLLWGNRVKILE